MALIIKLFLLAGMIVYDVLGILSGGLEVLSFGIVLQYLVTALVSFGASMAGIRLLRRFAADHGFGLFAGTAVNDTSSVTAAASTWDAMWGLGSETLDKAVTVKLTRTLAIIPITLVLAFIRTRKANGTDGKKVSFKKIFPFFILYFIGASVITTVAVSLGTDAAVFSPVKELSKFFIVLAMSAIGINTDIVKLVKTGGKPLILGACCWAGITGTSLLVQHLMGIW